MSSGNVWRPGWPKHKWKARRARSLRHWARRQRRLERRRGKAAAYKPDPAP